MNNLVSVIMPNYNGAKTISQAIDSVLNQTYKDFELIIVDDCSTDQSPTIIQAYVEKDSRVKFHQLKMNSGSPVVPTNEAIRHARGRFIAFLDSDDQWLPQKLEEQTKLFEAPEIAVVFSNYEKCDQDGTRNHRVISAPEHVNYRQLLCSNVIGNLTGVYDAAKTGKVYVQNYGHQDYILWLSILKKGFLAQNTNRVHGIYRTAHASSISRNKFKAMCWAWNIYYNVEKLPFPAACYYFSHYAIKSLCKFFK